MVAIMLVQVQCKPVQVQDLILQRKEENRIEARAGACWIDGLSSAAIVLTTGARQAV